VAYGAGVCCEALASPFGISYSPAGICAVTLEEALSRHADT